MELFIFMCGMGLGALGVCALVSFEHHQFPHNKDPEPWRRKEAS